MTDATILLEDVQKMKDKGEIAQAYIGLKETNRYTFSFFILWSVGVCCDTLCVLCSVSSVHVCLENTHSWACNLISSVKLLCAVFEKDLEIMGKCKIKLSGFPPSKPLIATWPSLGCHSPGWFVTFRTTVVTIVCGNAFIVTAQNAVTSWAVTENWIASFRRKTHKQEK